MPMPIDVGNSQGVSVNGRGEIVVIAPRSKMTKAEALVHAAWLVAVAGDDVDDVEDFLRVLQAVRET